MKNLLTCCLLGGLLLANSGCQKDEDAPALTSESCAPDKQPVKTVTNVEGTIGFYPTLQQYYIRRAIPGTFDSVDIGMLCGVVPARLQGVGEKIVFSGTYKPYDQPLPAAPAGQKFFYLEISKANVQAKNE